jgi:hypothetical protein
VVQETYGRVVTDEIVSGSQSGGPTTSHTIVVPALQALLEAVPPEAPLEAYESAAVEDNVLGKATLGARKRTFRYLRELYLLRPDSILFSALRFLWAQDERARPLLAGLCALARDPSFRSTASPIMKARPGDEITSGDLSAAVLEVFPGVYNDSTLGKIGRNSFSSWEQTGHLEAVKRIQKVRVDADCRPAAVAFALLLGHLQGASGAILFDTFWARILDRTQGTVMEQARTAAQAGFIDLRVFGGVVEVSVKPLLDARKVPQ